MEPHVGRYEKKIINRLDRWEPSSGAEKVAGYESELAVSTRATATSSGTVIGSTTTPAAVDSIHAAWATRGCGIRARPVFGSEMPSGASPTLPTFTMRT